MFHFQELTVSLWGLSLKVDHVSIADNVYGINLSTQKTCYNLYIIFVSYL